MNTEETRNYITAGNATLTLTSQVTGKHFTYRVRRCEKHKDYIRDPAPRFFVSLLTGSDNVNDYSYIGLLAPGDDGYLTFHTTHKSCATEDASSVKALRWLLRILNAHKDLDSVMATVQHEGRCGRCNRPLTHPESLQNGLGPECVRRVDR